MKTDFERRRAIKMFASAIAAPVLFSPSILKAQAPTELRVSLFLAANHPWVKDWLEPWGKEVANRTGGAVVLKFYGAGSAFGQANRQFDQVVAGAVDISAGMRGFPSGRFPLTSLIESPYMVRTANAASRALWDIFPQYLSKEYQGAKMLALHAQNSGPFHMKGVEINSTGDLKGLRIRSPGPVVNKLLEFYGAVPVGLPPSEMYEAFNRGTVDGAVMPFNGVAAYSLAELLTFHLDAGAATSAFYLAMNQKRFDELPAEIRAVIDETTGAAFLDRWGTWWDGWDKPGIEAAQKAGSKIVTLSSQDRERWKEEAKPVTAGLIAEIEAAGNPEAQDVYNALAAQIAKYES